MLRAAKFPRIVKACSVCGGSTPTLRSPPAGSAGPGGTSARASEVAVPVDPPGARGQPASVAPAPPGAGRQDSGGPACLQASVVVYRQSRRPVVHGDLDPTQPWAAGALVRVRSDIAQHRTPPPTRSAPPGT
jgi:hypothetical protein